MWLLEHFLRQLVRTGTLTVIDAKGRPFVFGDGGTPNVTVRLKTRVLHWKLFFNPELHAGEAYMDGTLAVESGSIYDFLDLMGRNLSNIPKWSIRRAIFKLQLLFRRVHQFNPVSRARKNVAHHYDLSGRLYELFLDRDRQYSCAYFARDNDDLETAQENKKRHIAAKLLPRKGQRVLDIGSGWGGLALTLARSFEVEVTGTTLSEEQWKAAKDRAEEAELSNRVRFLLRDYRELTGRYDRIVSVGMFEHVGIGHYDTFFRKVRELLTDDGVALLHTIGRSDGPGVTSPWVRKYIFPGGYIPALSEIMSSVERSGLVTTDIEVLRLHYAKTLRCWRENFLAQWNTVAEMYDERFCRMWEFYLAGSEIAFRHMGLVVFQVQLARRQDAAPLTRDYIGEAERRLAEARDPSRQAA